MVYAVYLVAAAAVGLLIGFVVLSIAWLRKTVSRNIRSKTISLMSVYDELLDQRSRTLDGIEADIRRKDSSTNTGMKYENIKSTQPAVQNFRATEMLDMAERVGGAVYRDEAVGGLYQKIRRNFSFRLEELLPVFQSVPERSVGPAGQLLSALDFDTVYRLSTLPGEDQTAILREVLTGEEITMLDSYLQENGEFHVLDFYDSLRSIADAEPKMARLHVPAGVVTDNTTKDGVEIIPDEGICEGFQLEEKNLLYDYCIKARELS